MAKEKLKESEPARSLSKSKLDKELKKLQAELCHLQTWVQEEGLRVADAEFEAVLNRQP